MRVTTIDAAEAAELREQGTMRREVNVADLRIVARHWVESDPFPGAPHVEVGPNRELAVTLNPHGAVCAITEDGTRLGIKPREFDFVCPFAEGRTYLDGSWRIDVAPGQVVRSEAGEGWTVSAVKLIRSASGWGWVVDVVAAVAAEPGTGSAA